MFCPNCGKEIKDGAAFCTWCGAKVQRRSAEAPAPTPAPAPQPEAAPAPAPMPQPEPAPAPEPQPAPAPKKRRGALIAVIVIALLVIAGAVGYVLWSMLSSAPFAIDDENFPNAAVRSAISEQLDPDGDGKITREEAAAATQLAITGTNDVSGLGEFFPNLTTLTIDAEQAGDGGTIAIDDLPELTTLEVVNSTVDSIDLSGNAKLETLTVSNAPVTSLDVSANTQLKQLSVGVTPNLESLDLSNNTQLTDLVLAMTGIGELDLSANTSLESLEIGGEGEGAITLPATETLTNVNVPEDRPLNGIENTGLREVWDMTSIYSVAAFFGDASERADIERDEQGRIASIVANNNRGTDTYEFSYDENGNVVGYSFSALDSDDVTITYNEDGNIASAEGDLSSRRYTYDDQGRVATMELVDEYGSSTTTFTYDDAGHLIREFIPDDGTTNYTEVEYTYDEAGNLTRRVEREGWGEGVAGTSGPSSAERRFEHEYDEAGNCVRTAISTGGVEDGEKSNDVEVAVFEATYDESGNITEFVASIKGDSEPVVETYVYDDRGVLTKIEGSEHWGYNYEFEYERRLVAKDEAEEATYGFVSDPMSAVGLGQNIYYNYCEYSLMAPDYVGSNATTRLSMVICDI